MILQDSVTNNPNTAEDRAEIINDLWGEEVRDRGRGLDWKAFFAYYTNECTSALSRDGHVTVKTHKDIVKSKI